ncbi:AraC family transcriptional regulator [Saccharobesus litoralis]|uniref:AraC family transcriptional regulator n=1 Tax=Saccharobesus litoralis TaxID=2172099 RepID=A0A2S0VR37_9ALTE|nr:helix-turn-helix domain-containing protein [Saccharobesus litoralis]AWB66659.1 AraC family transcriptional regulator [Saccharobesus litoralis]
MADNILEQQAALLQQAGLEQILGMYDLVPDILFWVKDNRHRFLFANQLLLSHVGLTRLQDLLGKTDFDFSPHYLAAQYAKDDEKVLAGQIVNERLEMNMCLDGEIAWYLTSKRPIINSQSEIIGSYGITRHLQKTASTLSGIKAVQQPVDYIREHFQSNITIEQLAELVHVSVSALERRFKKHLKKTPWQFLTEVRLENARRLLVETDLPISQIGYDSGFSDHSYFAKQFKLFFGELPSIFREQYQKKLG